MRDNYEVITTDDKAKRDFIFNDLRTTGNYLERQAVKFSGVREVLDKDGNPDFIDRADGSMRPLYVSTFSVAHPKRGDSLPTRRRRLKEAAATRAHFAARMVEPVEELA